MIKKRYQAQYHKLKNFYHGVHGVSRRNKRFSYHNSVVLRDLRGYILLKMALFAALFFFSLTSSLWAQNRRYVTEQRFIQRLVWVGDEYAFRYEVVIERNEGDGYREYKREFTASSELVISLPLGKYRYRIIPYDFLDQGGEASGWVTLDVVAPPVIPGETPEQSASSVPKKNINIFLSAAWSPVFPVYGGMQEIFGNELFTTGASVRFGVLYSKPQWFHPGIELSTSWYALNNAQDNDTIGIQAGVTGFNIVAQTWFPGQKTALTFRAGGAFAFQVGKLGFEQYSYSMGSLAPQINLEASFLWLALKQLYAEAGLGFNHLMNEDGNSGCLRPWIGAGWRF